MKIKDIIKKQTTIIAIAVILVTLAVIGISYALFFQVNTNTVNQEITAGTLTLTVSFTPSEGEKIEPITTAEGLTSEPINYTVNNGGNLPANYILYIGGTSKNTIPLSSIKYSIDGTSSAVVTSGASITGDDGLTYYQFDSSSLTAGGTSEQKQLRVWVDEDLVSDEINNGNLNLQLYIVSEVNETSS